MPICYFSSRTQRDSYLCCPFCTEVSCTLHYISDIKVIIASLGLCQRLRQFGGKQWQPQHHTSREDGFGTQPGLHSSYFCTHKTTCKSNIYSQLLYLLISSYGSASFLSVASSSHFPCIIYNLGNTFAHRTCQLLSYLHLSVLVWAAGNPFVQVGQPRAYLSSGWVQYGFLHQGLAHRWQHMKWTVLPWRRQAALSWSKLLGHWISFFQTCISPQWETSALDK